MTYLPGDRRVYVESKGDLSVNISITWHTYLVRVVSAVAVSAGLQGTAVAQVVDFDIESNRTDEVLLDIAEAGKVQIVFSPAVAQRTESPAVRGRQTVQSALDVALSATDLEYEFRAKDFVIVKERRNSRSDVLAIDYGDGEAQRPAPILLTQPQSDTRQNSEPSAAPGVGDMSEESFEIITVTGTRIKNMSPASPLISISRQEIDARGFNSIEEVLRAVPQSYSGINSGSHVDGSAPRNSQGASVANLRGLGIGSTLILVNGRRIAASPAENSTFTDISTIPFAAIERVEILLDGASAAYGADAVGGVVNFILKKDYSGAETRMRYENSNADAHSQTIEQLVGVNWTSGNFTGSLSYTRSDPTTPSGVGITTLDHRDRGGRDWRNPLFNALAPASFAGITIPGAPAGTAICLLPVGSGVGLDASDLIYVSQEDFDNQTGNYDLARPSSAALANSIVPDTRIVSASLSVTQAVSSFLEFYAEGFYSERETIVQRGGYIVTGVDVPVTNIYNTFGQPVRTAYDFTNEIAAGIVRVPTDETEVARYAVNTGIEADLPYRDWQVKFDIGASEESITGSRINIYSFGVARARGADLAPAAAFDAALADGLNLFGGGTVQLSPEQLADIVYDQDQGERISKLTSIELVGSGTLLNMAGGALSLAAGIDFRNEQLDNRNYQPAPLSFEGVFGVPGGPEILPERDLRAAFLELAIPFFGENNQRTGLRELVLSLQGRHENYEISGPLGDVQIDLTTGGLIFPEDTEVSYTEFSPKIGITWRPVSSLKTRATWSGGFQSPTLPELYTPTLVQPTFGFDPLTGGFGPIAQLVGGNSDLQPQESETATVGFDYTPSSLPGFSFSATWFRTEFNNQIGLPSRSIGALLFTNPEAFPQLITTTDQFVDVLGTEVTLIDLRFGNIGDAIVEAIDFDVSYAFDWGASELMVGLAGTYTIESTLDFFNIANGELPAEATATLTDSIEATNRGPDRLKLYAYVNWRRDDWNSNLYVRHTSDYDHFGPTGVGVSAAGAPRPGVVASLDVSSYTTVDTQLAYDFDSDWSFRLGATNLFDKDFPFIDVRLGADPSRVDFRRRVIYVAIDKAFEF